MFSEVATINAHGRHAQAVHFTRDGKLLVSVGEDARVRLWSVPGFESAGTFEGHKNSVNTISLTPDEQILATGSTDATVRLWSFPQGECLHTLNNQVNAVFAPDGNRLATVSARGQVILWDAKSAKQLSSIPAVDKRTTAVVFSPDGSTILIGGTGPIHRVTVADLTKQGELTGHKVVVACMRLSPDRKCLASTGGDGHLRFWSTGDWTEIRSVRLAESGVLQIAFAPKSDSVSVASDYLIQSYSVKDGTVLDRIEVPVKGVYGIAVSPDGKYLANAAADGKVRVWEAARSRG